MPDLEKNYDVLGFTLQNRYSLHDIDNQQERQHIPLTKFEREGVLAIPAYVKQNKTSERSAGGITKTDIDFSSMDNKI